MAEFLYIYIIIFKHGSSILLSREVGLRGKMTHVIMEDNSRNKINFASLYSLGHKSGAIAKPS